MLLQLSKLGDEEYNNNYFFRFWRRERRPPKKPVKPPKKPTKQTAMIPPMDMTLQPPMRIWKWMKLQLFPRRRRESPKSKMMNNLLFLIVNNFSLLSQVPPWSLLMFFCYMFKINNPNTIWISIYSFEESHYFLGLLLELLLVADLDALRFFFFSAAAVAGSMAAGLVLKGIQ